MSVTCRGKKWVRKAKSPENMSIRVIQKHDPDIKEEVKD